MKYKSHTFPIGTHDFQVATNEGNFQLASGKVSRLGRKPITHKQRSAVKAMHAVILKAADAHLASASAGDETPFTDKARIALRAAGF